MHRNKHRDRLAKACVQCKALIKKGDGYDGPSGKMCDTCYMESRIAPKRKTHWQYLRSPKSDYLRDGRPARKASKR